MILRAARAYRAALSAIAGRSAVPYGYTVTLWSSGTLLMHARGTPTVAEVFLFMAGALCAFVALGAFIRTTDTDGIEPSPTELVTTGILNLVAVSAAVGSVALIALIPSAVDWALGSSAATTIYLAGCALALAFASARERRATTAAESAEHRAAAIAEPPADSA